MFIFLLSELTGGEREGGGGEEGGAIANSSFQNKKEEQKCSSGADGFACRGAEDDYMIQLGDSVKFHSNSVKNLERGGERGEIIAGVNSEFLP